MSKILEDRHNYGRKGGNWQPGSPCWYAFTPDDGTLIRKAWFKGEAELGEEAVAALLPDAGGSGAWLFHFVCKSVNPEDLPYYAKPPCYGPMDRLVYVPCRKGTVSLGDGVICK